MSAIGAGREAPGAAPDAAPDDAAPDAADMAVTGCMVSLGWLPFLNAGITALR